MARAIGFEPRALFPFSPPMTTFFFNDALAAFQINRDGKPVAFRETLAEVRAFLTS